MVDIIQNYVGGDYGRTATANAQPFRGVVVHVTGKPDLQSEISYMGAPDPNRAGYYGYHYLIDRDGTVYHTAPDDVRTNHIMPNSQFGLNNSNALGVALVGADKSTTPQQIAAGTQLINQIRAQYNIPSNMVVSHGQLDASRETGLNSDGGAEGADFMKAYSGQPTVAQTAASAVAQPGQNFNRPSGPSAAIYQGLVQRGFNPAQAAALAGNIQQESNFSPSSNNEKEGAFGLLQWRLDRRDNLNAFAAAQGKPPDDLGTQLDFIKHEMGGSEAQNASAFLGANDVGSANAALRSYIRYGDNTESTRLANAQAIASGNFGAGGSGAPAAVAQTQTAAPPNMGSMIGQALAGMASPGGGGGGGMDNAALAQAAPPAPGPQLAFRAAADDAAQASNLTAGGPSGSAAPGQPATGAGGMTGLLGLMADPNAQNQIQMPSDMPMVGMSGLLYSGGAGLGIRRPAVTRLT